MHTIAVGTCTKKRKSRSHEHMTMYFQNTREPQLGILCLICILKLILTISCARHTFRIQWYTASPPLAVWSAEGIEKTPWRAMEVMDGQGLDVLMVSVSNTNGSNSKNLDEVGAYILERKMGRSVEVKPYLSCQECLCNGILCLRYTVIQNPAATTIVGWSGQISQYITNNDLPSWAILFLQYCPPEGPIPASDVAMKLAHMDDVHKFWVLLWVNWRSAQEWLWHRAKEHMLHEIAQ